MHLCFLTPEYPHPSIGTSGGLGSSIKNLATQLVKEGVQVTVVVCGRQREQVFVDEGIAFYIMKQVKYPLFGFYLYRKHIERYLNILIRDTHIDLVEAPDWTGITAFMHLKAPLVIRFHGSDAYFCKLDGRPQKKKNYWFENNALKRADYLLSVSAFTAKVTKALFQLNKEIKVIPNSINTARFQPQPEKELPGRVLYFGTLIRKKGVLELSKIFNRVNRQLPDTQFILAGKDVRDVFTKQSTKAMMLEEMSSDTRKQTRFLEELPYDAIQQEIAKATVAVLPSFAEALPMTWLEAMAMEKALVTSDIGWAQEVMVDGETGFTVAPKNHEHYAERIVTLLQEPKLRSQLGTQARQRVVEHFSSEVVTLQNIDY
ncbi:glycosyltransferase family 4 protein, partial [uncultured Planktosalinus sp.]|uniref:glycosyltransferase family 4 protein n=1 Tax=uncultured Planktosalinus sp. TaxID=1810935 RepID=UPI0030DA631C